MLARTASPGLGKTRLRREVPDGQVDGLAAAFLHDTVERSAAWTEAVGARLLIAYDGPPEDLPESRAVLVPQAAGDLGARIDAALAAAFAGGAGAAVLIGTDSPNLPLAMVAACFDGLRAAPVSVLPATDGGWVAIGSRRPLDGCLATVRWSTHHTCADTVAALAAAGRPPLVLEPWYDVDDLPSLRRLHAALTADSAGAPRTARLLARLMP